MVERRTHSNLLFASSCYTFCCNFTCILHHSTIPRRYMSPKQPMKICSSIIRSETEEPSDGLSRIAARVLATSLPMYRKLLFTKLSPSLDTTQLMILPVTTQQSPAEVELMFLSCCRRHLRSTYSLYSCPPSRK